LRSSDGVRWVIDALSSNRSADGKLVLMRWRATAFDVIVEHVKSLRDKSVNDFT